MPQRFNQPGGSGGARSPSSPPPVSPASVDSIKNEQQELAYPSQSLPLEPASPIKRTFSFNRTSSPAINDAVTAVARLPMSATAQQGNRTQDERPAATSTSSHPAVDTRLLPAADASTSPGSKTDSRTSRSLFSKKIQTADDQPNDPFVEHVGAAYQAAAEATRRAKSARELADDKLRAVGFEYPKMRGEFTDAEKDGTAATQVLAGGTTDEAHRVAEEAVQRAKEAQKIADEKLSSAGLGFLCKEQRDSTNAVPKPGLQATADSDDDDDDVQEDLRARMKRVIADKGLETQGVESGVTQFAAHTPSS